MAPSYRLPFGHQDRRAFGEFPEECDALVLARGESLAFLLVESRGHVVEQLADDLGAAGAGTCTTSDRVGPLGDLE